jgi:copper chaperone CopZ
MKLKVKNMTCVHCVNKISVALIKENIIPEIDLDSREISISDAKHKEKVISILKSINYIVE